LSSWNFRYAFEDLEELLNNNPMIADLEKPEKANYDGIRVTCQVSKEAYGYLTIVGILLPAGVPDELMEMIRIVAYCDGEIIDPHIFNDVLSGTAFVCQKTSQHRILVQLKSGKEEISDEELRRLKSDEVSVAHGVELMKRIAKDLELQSRYEAAKPYTREEREAHIREILGRPETSD